MSISVGTFNLNNLFSRYNFRAAVESIPPQDAGGIAITFTPDAVDVKTFMGRLVKPKDMGGTAEIARRVLEMDCDILAVQEVEHIEILRSFNRDNLGGLYPHIALIEGNDSRMIDVGVMSKLPLGPITSHQAATHPDDPARRVFSRDLLQVSVLKPDGKKAFTLYNTHLKSNYVPFGQDPVAGAAAANARRKRQAETISKVISAQERAGAKFVLLGDMNDSEASPHIAPMLVADGQPLHNALQNALETRPAKDESPNQGPGPQSTMWTNRFNPPGPEFPRYELFDQIWVSDGLKDSIVSAHIDRRKKHGGDGSDHDPAWIVINV